MRALSAGWSESSGGSREHRDDGAVPRPATVARGARGTAWRERAVGVDARGPGPRRLGGPRGSRPRPLPGLQGRAHRSRLRHLRRGVELSGSAVPPVHGGARARLPWVVAGQTAAEVSPSRKVRTPQGTAVGNAHPGKPAGKCHRKDTADGAATREPRTGKGEMVR